MREVEGSTGENIRRVGGVESRAVDAPSQYPGVPVDCGRLDARRLDELALREEVKDSIFYDAVMNLNLTDEEMDELFPPTPPPE